MRLQFSIRSLWLTTFGAAIVIAIYAHQWRRQHDRLHAMTQIERDSGFVVFRNAEGGVPLDTHVDRRRDRVDAVYLAGSALDTKTLEGLSSLDDARFVSFNSSAFGDEHVVFLDALTNLRNLQLNGTRISRTGLLHLSRQHPLTVLTLNDTSVDDGCVDVLANLDSLTKLCILNTDVSESAVETLRSRLPRCEIVWQCRR